MNKRKSVIISLFFVIITLFSNIGETKDSDNVIWLVEPQFDEAENFSESLAMVRKDKKIFYIDRSGKIVIEPQVIAGSQFYNGLAPVMNADGKCGYINKEGRIVIEPQYEYHDHLNRMYFSEGLASVKKNGRWGYINREGKMVIKPQFDDAYGFSEGLAPVKIYNQWGLRW
jgi:hypothetical protein